MEQGKPLSAPESPLVDLGAFCQKVRAALAPVRAHAVSLHDERGDVLWLSANSMGPDEHDAVRDALEVFDQIGGPPAVAYDLGNSRSAVLFRAMSTRRLLLGAVMIVTDTRSIQGAQGAIKLLTPRLERTLADFSAMRPDAKPPPPTSAQIAARTVTPEVDRLHAALRRSPIALNVQHLVPLTKGGRLRRYEVLLRSAADDAPNVAPHAMLKAAVDNGLGSMIDRRVVTALVAWLVRHPSVCRTDPAMFSVNLTATALHDEHFIKFVELCLAKSALTQGMIAFEIDVPTAVKSGDKVGVMATALHRLGCPLVLDDFRMRTECFDLLRLPAVRYIKFAAEITAKMRSDKLSQAAITAVVQMSRVLGMHTVAKHTETAAEREWLTALGVDFIQSKALSPPVAIESLSKI